MGIGQMLQNQSNFLLEGTCGTHLAQPIAGPTCINLHRIYAVEFWISTSGQCLITVIATFP